MKNKTFIVVLFIYLFIAISFPCKTNCVNANELTSAKSMCLIESTSKRILFSKNENLKLANASTTKIVTFLTVLKNCENFEKKISIDRRAVGIAGTSIYLKEGEELTIKELLYGMMLVSGNDAATALALSISPTISDFANLMTVEAKKCGAVNSSFKNPHGLDEDGHYTTAYDLALITAECYKYDLFREIVSTKNIKISNITGYRYLKNKNKLLTTLDGCVGVKTGFTNDAGRCLVSSAIRDNMQVICVVLNCGPMFEESYSLIEKSFKTYKLTTLISPYSYVRSIKVNNSNNCESKTFIQKGFSYPLTESEKQNINIEYNIPKVLYAPVEKEQVVGDIKIYLDNNLLFCEKIYTMEEIKSNKVMDNLKRVILNW